MNGLQVTGMKLSSPAPVKKTTVPPKKIAQKPKIVAKAPIKKSSVPVQKKTQAPIEKKKVQQKVQEKPQQPIVKKQEVVQEEKKIEETVEAPTQPIKQEPQIADFEVTLRYNHYKDKFACSKGILSFAVPNEKYCFGLVFMGNYQPKIRHYQTRDIIQPLTTGKADQFTWKVEQGQVYEIQIDEDEEEQAKRERHVYKAPEQPKKCPMKKNHRVDELTEQMKRLGITQLGSQKHRQLLQQRDLQDILYS